MWYGVAWTGARSKLTRVCFYFGLLCEVVLLGWSFRVLFVWLSSSSFVASAVQGGTVVHVSFPLFFPFLLSFLIICHCFPPQERVKPSKVAKDIHTNRVSPFCLSLWI